jgi:hypothetical protein
MQPPKFFYITRSNGQRVGIRWELVEPYEHQLKRNHVQTLEQLHARGGLDVPELWAAMANNNHMTARQVYDAALRYRTDKQLAETIDTWFNALVEKSTSYPNLPWVAVATTSYYDDVFVVAAFATNVLAEKVLAHLRKELADGEALHLEERR